MRRLVLIALLAVSLLTLTVVGAEPLGAADPAPRWEHVSGGWNRSSSPVVANVVGDAIPEIVHGDQNGYLHVRNAANGQDVPNWPQAVRVVHRGATTAPIAVDSSPAVGDLDNDGINEIVVGIGSTWQPNRPGGVVIFGANGARRCQYLTRDYGNIWANTPGADGYPDAVFSSPTLGDVDGDGRMDIVVGGFDLHIHAIDRNCNPIAGFPYNVEDSTWSSPALFDVDGDGRQEIFIGSDQYAGGAIDWSGGEFRSLDVQGGRVVERWRNRTNEVIHSSPAIGDINGDGRMEVVVGGGDYYGRSDGKRLFAWHIDDGSPVPGWAGGRPTFGVIRSSPAIGDLNGDGVDDVVVGSRDGLVWAFRGNGSYLWWRDPIPNCCVPAGGIDASPIIADLDGDGDQDVAIGTNVAFHMLRGHDGSVLASAPSFGWSYEAAAAIGDFGPSGRLLITAGFDTPNGRSRIAAYPIAAGAAPDWPMFQKDALHLGAPPSGGDPLPPGFCRPSSNPIPNPSPASARGYWILTRNGTVDPNGSLSHYGNFRDWYITTPAVSIAARRDGNGYWLVDEQGLVHSFGTSFHGDMRGRHVNGRIIALEPTPTGNGYWLLGADGGIFTFGDATFYGSTGSMHLNAPIIGMKATPSGDGYWLLAADGGVFTFGQAAFHGSTGSMRLNAPVISMAVHPSGIGYWLLASDGGVFTFGRGMGYHGSVPGTGLCHTAPITQIRPTFTGRGYWVLGADGGVFAFGDAAFHGSYAGLPWSNRAVDMAVVQ